MNTLSRGAAAARPPQDWEVLLGFLWESISLIFTSSRKNTREEDQTHPIALGSVLDLRPKSISLLPAGGSV